MQEPVKGLVYDIQRYSIHDGPGIRTLIFFKGCPLQCLWCSNPESQSNQVEMLHSSLKCIMCRKCVSICEQNAIVWNQRDSIRIDLARCNGCGLCTDQCYSGGMKKVGQLYSAEELLEEALQDEPFYQTSGGGVTIGGGEPLYQPEFLKEFLKACQRRSVHTALETSGYAPSEDFSQLTEMVDVVLMDLKHVDDEKHRRMTKVSNRTILRNLRNIRKTGKKIICRVPVIPGFNETEPELIQIGRFLLSVDCTDIHLLPYHRLGEGKYAALGREYPLKGVQPPAEAYVRGVSESLVRLGLNVQIGG